MITSITIKGNILCTINFNFRFNFSFGFYFDIVVNYDQRIDQNEPFELRPRQFEFQCKTNQSTINTNPFINHLLFICII